MQRESFNTEVNDLAKFLHQAVLDPHLSIESFNAICDASIYFNFSGLCTSLIRIPLARKRLGANKTTKLIAVIGFPFGDMPHPFKQAQAEWAAEQGAEEFDVVPDFLELHQGHINKVADELAKVCEIGLPTRAIIDATKLNQSCLSLAIEASIDAGVRGIQTGSGFSGKVTIQKVGEIAQLIKGRCSIKAAGGIKNLSETIELIQAGCSEIGTSIGPQLMKDFRQLNK